MIATWRTKRKRTEYVDAQQGVLFKGFPYWIQLVLWGFEQFEGSTLDVLLTLLSRVAQESGLDACADVVSLSRLFSALVNSNDANGLVVGNWSCDYSGFAAPSSWDGSGSVPKAYLNNRKQPVKHGQCFVFAGVLTTLFRSLGIPSRLVTCYWSAHDTQGNARIDKFFSTDGKLDGESTIVSIWTYHVWVEAWFERKDLLRAHGNAFGGWQVLDATPQEISKDGLFQCGPASVAAIKQGKVDKIVAFDHQFVLGVRNNKMPPVHIPTSMCCC